MFTPVISFFLKWPNQIYNQQLETQNHDLIPGHHLRVEDGQAPRVRPLLRL